MKKNNTKHFFTTILLLVVVASLITFAFNASADGNLLSDSDTKTEYPKGDLPSEVLELPVLDEFGQVIYDNLETILRTSDVFNQDDFNWMKDNKNSSDYGALIDSYINAVDQNRTNKTVAIINDFIHINHYSSTFQEEVNSGDPIPTTDSPEFVEAAKELEETLNELEVNSAAPQGSTIQTFGAATFRNRGVSPLETDTGYAVKSAQGLAGLDEAYKTISETNKFRQIDVELSLVPKVLSDGEGEGVDADIVLVLDESSSMTGEKWTAVREVASEVSRQIFTMSPNSKVGVVTYKSGSNAATIISPLRGASEVEQLVDAIMKRYAIGGYTNMQSGIVMAKEKVLMMDDTWTADDVKATGRKKLIINLTDGMPNDPFTDMEHNWPTSSSLPIAHKNLKRWGKYNIVPGQIHAAGNSIITKGTRWINNDIDPRTVSHWESAHSEMGTEAQGELAYVLESQYTVYQGVDLFAIDYSTDDYDMEGQLDPIETQRRAREVLKLSTYKMIDPPESFRYDPGLWDNSVSFEERLKIAERNPIQNSSYTSVGYEGRVYSAENAEELLAAFEDILTVIKGKVPTYTVEDYYNSDVYELISGPTASGGESAIAEVSSTGNSVTWVSKGQSLSKRTVKYTLRVKDEPLFPNGAGKYNNGAPTLQDKLPTGGAAKITFIDGSGNTHSYDYEIPVVSIQRLIDGEAFGYDRDGNILGSVFTDKLYLGGNITRGNGNYSFEWFNGPDDSGIPITTAPIDVNSTDQGFGLSIPLDKTGPIVDSDEGNKQYTLKLYDDIATTDGYRSKGVSYILLTIDVKVVCGEVRITVVGVDDGQKTKGLFETRVTKGLNTDLAEEFDRWYFLGPDTKVYNVGLFVDPNASTTTTTGSIKMTAETYIPYGYELKVVKSDSVEPTNIGVIELNPIKSGSDWSLPSKEIIIEVKKVERKFFYDWAWGQNKENTVIFNKETTVK